MRTAVVLPFPLSSRSPYPLPSPCPAPLSLPDSQLTMATYVAAWLADVVRSAWLELSAPPTTTPTTTENADADVLPIELLPTELLLAVLAALPMADLVRCRSVCRRWRDAVRAIETRDAAHVFRCGYDHLLSVWTRYSGVRTLEEDFTGNRRSSSDRFERLVARLDEVAVVWLRRGPGAARPRLAERSAAAAATAVVVRVEACDGTLRRAVGVGGAASPRALGGGRRRRQAGDRAGGAGVHGVAVLGRARDPSVRSPRRAARGLAPDVASAVLRRRARRCSPNSCSTPRTGRTTSTNLKRGSLRPSFTPTKHGSARGGAATIHWRRRWWTP